MSPSLISRNADLSRLRDEGYEVAIVNNHLVISHVPYVDGELQVRFGTLVSDLTLAGDVTQPPENHVAMFDGDEPCDAEGRPLTKLILDAAAMQVSETLTTTHRFSSKPVAPARYEDYHHKMTTYIAILGGPAEDRDPEATAKTFAPVDADEDDVFVYHDTASSKAGIAMLTDKLRIGPVAIIGAGGTGSYVLDLLAKTPLAEIHLYDADVFSQHNAFRSPGAATRDELAARMTKVAYLTARYSAMRREVIPHPYRLDAGNVAELAPMVFVFIAIDDGPAKVPIIVYLEDAGIPFIDVGMGIYQDEGHVAGVVRSTLSTDREGSREAARKRISTTEVELGDYATNIQIAELNALNAALAVIRFKKHLGFYADDEDEHTAVYMITDNVIGNEDGSND